ncbi:MAG TPA: hydrogenase expression/formation protein HypE [Solirubrobacteraceae bacterium]|jgi:hydrogenase expression/formation protein HypE|nr:hydrogenase expression/formation protein HypE [Solirubrobacteraceae bacterium]
MTGAVIQLDHGTGGGMSQELIGELIAPRLGAVHSGRMEDSAVLELDSRRIAVTTDSFVVDPIFFGNGDIGKLAVCGTVNDLAVAGAVPRYLTLSLVLEEGFPIADLERILDSVRDAAAAARVEVVAGDTKVVRAGEVDKLFINTAGVGVFEREIELGVGRIVPGDTVIVTGWLGNHSIHILSLREGLGFEERVLSDCAPLDGLVGSVLEEHAPWVRCMRDITRGGLGTVLNELAEGAGVSIQIEERSLPIQRETAMAADMLGVNPLYLANEGNICMFVAPEAAEAVLELVRTHPHGDAAQIVGAVRERVGSPVTMVGADGGEAVVELLYGAELPRLC